jgi:hypothetical protein
MEQNNLLNGHESQLHFLGGLNLLSLPKNGLTESNVGNSFVVPYLRGMAGLNRQTHGQLSLFFPLNVQIPQLFQ